MARSSFLELIVGIFALATLASATQVMHRPANYKGALTGSTSEPTDVQPQSIQKRASGMVSTGYFTNWGIYGANFQPTDIVPSTLTHINYAFADVTADTGNVKLTDSYADEQKHFAGDSWDETGNNLYGCLKQLYLLKQKNRNLKTLLSVGGWTYSQDNHFSFIPDSSKRATFVKDAVQLVSDYAFDGIDIDFEYPANDAQGQGLADLFTELRSAFDDLAKSNGDSVPYQLSVAVAAGAANYQYLKVPQMDKALTYWNLMAYDYAGSWLNYTDNQANLYGGVRTGVSTDKAVQWYFSQGATPAKMNMGIPLYGRAFEETVGIGASYNGIGPGTTEAGIYSYSALPLAGAQVFENTTDVTSYSYDSAKKELVSYDTPNTVKTKAKYVLSKGMAGTMFWDLSTDKVGSDSLVGTASGVYGTLDQTQNHLNYPNSKWDNIRNQMGSSPGTSPTATTTSQPTSTTSQPTSTSNPGTGSCAGVTAWSASTVYVGGNKATYGGHLWSAKWWTEGDTPGGSADVWVDKGAC
ncbi:glycoside hydrolase family 18 protein [Amylostereum chailletii]|nr:glycoside hydrolase family 18 protein [Amylostereum chailletii]